MKRALIACIAVVATFGLLAASAAATTFHVTTASDPAGGTCTAGSCSLRQAIAAAADGDTIDVPALHITLSQGELLINASITIDGAGAGTTNIDGGGTSRVIHVDGPGCCTESSASVTLKNLTVDGGSVTRSPAGSNAGGAGIQFDSSGALRLVGVDVTGNSFTASSVSGGAQGIGGAGIFSLSSVALTDSLVSLNQLTIDGAHGNSGGGGVFVASGDLILANSTISDNTAVVTEGSVTSGRDGGGGAYLANGGFDVLLDSTTIGGNTFSLVGSQSASGDGGGGLYTQGVSILATASTFAGNQANVSNDPAGEGGGAVLDAGSGSAYTNSTFEGNTAHVAGLLIDEGGGAIYYSGSSSLSTLANDTFAANAQVGGMGATLYDEGTTLVVADTILSSGSASTANCDLNGQTVDSDGYNLYDDTANSCALTGTGDQHVVNLGLGAYGNHGGLTPTVALVPGSAAVNAGNPSGCTDALGNPLGFDERGVARPQPAGGRCDVGAYELAPPMVATGLAGGIGTSSATLQGSVANPDPQQGMLYFQYGRSANYTNTTPTVTLAGGAPASSASAQLTKLKPGTYHFRIVASNPDGTTDGADSTFVVPAGGPVRPAVLTGVAKSIGTTSATLTGELDGFGLATKYQFQFGPTRKYGHKTRLKSAGARNKVLSVAIHVRGLARGHRLHYRLVAISAAGRSNGPDQTLTMKL